MYSYEMMFQDANLSHDVNQFLKEHVVLVEQLL